MFWLWDLMRRPVRRRDSMEVLKNCEWNDFSPVGKRSKTEETLHISYTSLKQIDKQV
jgi:hypothetical protein